jgi:hypothetical protein
MRKQALIEMLSKIEGNPEIKLWNGYVQDWVDIDSEFVPVRLIKETLDYHLEMCRLEKCRDAGDYTLELSAEYLQKIKQNSKLSWELNEYVNSDDIKSKKYKAKKVYIIQAKKKGVNTFDRAGSIQY